MVNHGTEKKRPTVCLTGASFATSNMGVNALTAGTIKSFYTKYPYGEMFLLDYAKNAVTYDLRVGSGTFQVRLDNIRFSKKFYLKNNIALLLVLAILSRAIPIKRLRRGLIARNYWLSRIDGADFVASMAGGDSFSDIYGLGRFLYVALPQFLGLSMGKRLVILPQTIGPFKGKLASSMAKYILKRADVIYSRDCEGVEVVRDILGPAFIINGNARFCHDVGFVLDPVTPAHINSCLNSEHNRNNPMVGLNISGLLYCGGYRGNNMFGLRLDYKTLIYDLIDYMIKEKNATILLVPHVFGTQEESDSIASEKVYAAMKDRYDDRILMVGDRYDQSEIKYIIGKCDFFIGSRMHACIGALSQNIPTVSIAYSRKFVGVMKTIGVEDLVADPRKLEKQEILSIVDNAFEKRASLRNHLETMMPEVKENVLNLFNEIGSRVLSG